jgi:hypothetical protein
MFTLALRMEPWQWTSNYKTPSNTSYLMTSTTPLYKDYKMRVEEAVGIIF